MSVSGALVVVCFLFLMGLGAFLLLYAIFQLTQRGAQVSQVSLPWLKIELKGPAWLIVVFVGAVMLASPVIAAELQKPAGVTAPPPSVLNVQSIEEPNYTAFRFVRDVSILDLRASVTAPWYAPLVGLVQMGNKQKIRPTVLKNYMVVRKVSAADTIQLTYATSGLLDIRCLTQSATYQVSHSKQGSSETEGWKVIADVSSIPIGTEFQVIVEATYWNAFSGEAGDDYTTYAHNQVDPEEISAVVLFPADKPMKDISVTEYTPDSERGSPPQTSFQEWKGPQGHSYFWTTTNVRPRYYYKFAWKW